MKLTNGDLFASKEAFGRLVGNDDIEVKYKFPIVKLVKKLEDDFAAIEEQRNGLVKKYGEEKDGQIRVDEKSENFGKFVSDFNTLMQMENEVVIKKVQIPDNIKMKGIDIAVLEPFIEIVTIK